MSYNEYRVKRITPRTTNVTEMTRVDDEMTHVDDEMTHVDDEMTRADDEMTRADEADEGLELTLRKSYPPACEAGDVIAVAWHNQFSIGKIMSRVEEGERRVIRMEEFDNKDIDKGVFRERKTRKKIVDIQSECIIETGDWRINDSTKNLIKILNMEVIKEHYALYKKHFFE